MKVRFILYIIFFLYNFGFTQSEKHKPIIFKGTVICDSLKIPIDSAKVEIISDCNEIIKIKTNIEGQFYDTIMISSLAQKAVISISANNQMSKKILIDSLNNKSICDLGKIPILPVFISRSCFSPILFNSNTTVLKDSTAIDFVLSILVNNPNLIIELSGYNAPDENNIALERVYSVKKYFLDHGIEESRIQIKSIDSNNRPYYEKKCGSIPYYKMNESDIIINKEFIKSINDKKMKEVYRDLMRCVLIKIHDFK